MLFGNSFDRFFYLVGWLSTYLSGYLHRYLHRDISIGNVLMTDKPVKRKMFEIPQGVRKSPLVVAGPESGGNDHGAVHAS
jgi:hypothetical protein